VPSTVLWPADGAASVPEMPAGSIKSFTRLGPSLVRTGTEIETGAHCTNCSPAWTIHPIPSTRHCRDCRFLTDSFRKSFLLFTIKLYNSLSQCEHTAALQSALEYHTFILFLFNILLCRSAILQFPSQVQ